MPGAELASAPPVFAEESWKAGRVATDEVEVHCSDVNVNFLQDGEWEV
jgi:hypothetical protein